MIRKILIYTIKIYRQFISPLFPPSCRFQPTCSQYAIDALTTFGFYRGGYLAIKRILRCHPFHPGGYDPIPHSLEEMILFSKISKKLKIKKTGNKIYN